MNDFGIRGVQRSEREQQQSSHVIMSACELMVDYSDSSIDVAGKKLERQNCDCSHISQPKQHRKSMQSAQFQGGHPRLVTAISAI